MVAQAALSGWGVAAGGFLALAAAALALKGPARALGVAAGLSLAAALGAIALFAAPAAPPSGLTLPAAAAPGALVDPAAPGLELLAEAERLLNGGDNQAAAEILSRALELYNDSDDLAGQGHVYLGFGRVDHFTGQADAARAHYARALGLYQEAGSLADQARVLMAMGDLERDTFQWDVAAGYFREGRRVWAMAPEPKSDPHALLRLETVASIPEGAEAAWAVLDQAALIFDNLGDIDGLGDVAMLSADLFAALGDSHAALSDFAVAVVRYREAGNREREALASVRTAEFEVLEGHNAEAVMRLDRAESIFADVSDPRGSALVLATRGDLARLLGDFSAASSYYTRAAETFRASGDPAAATALLRLGQVEAHTGNAAAAERALEAAVGLYAAGGDPGGESAAHLVLGRLAAAAGDPNTARGHWVSAADLAGQAGDALGQGRAQLRLADLAAVAGQIDAARARYDAAERKFSEAPAPMGAVLVALGRAGLARAEPEDAVAGAYREAAAAMAALADPVAEANRYLGLPPVSRIDLVNELDQELGGDDPDLGAAARLAAERDANQAAYPDHNLEGRGFLADIEVRIASGMAAAN